VAAASRSHDPYGKTQPPQADYETAAAGSPAALYGLASQGPTAAGVVAEYSTAAQTLAQDPTYQMAMQQQQQQQGGVADYDAAGNTQGGVADYDAAGNTTVTAQYDVAMQHQGTSSSRRPSFQEADATYDTAAAHTIGRGGAPSSTDHQAQRHQPLQQDYDVAGSGATMRGAEAMPLYDSADGALAMPNSISASGRSTSYDRALDTAGVGSAAVAVPTYDTANDGATYQPTVRAKGSVRPLGEPTYDVSSTTPPLQAPANYSMADPVQDGAPPTAAAAYHAAGPGAEGVDGGRAAATAPPQAAYDIGAPSSGRGSIGHATYNAAGSATATGEETIYDEATMADAPRGASADNDFKSNDFLVEGSDLKITSVRRANPLYRQSTFENLGETPGTGVSKEESA
jgi:hypothetical protein